MKVLVIKDEENILRPGAGIWPAESVPLVKAVKEEWENNLSRKKQFKNCALVEANLEEII